MTCISIAIGVTVTVAGLAMAALGLYVGRVARRTAIKVVVAYHRKQHQQEEE